MILLTDEWVCRGEMLEASEFCCTYIHTCMHAFTYRWVRLQRRDVHKHHSLGVHTYIHACIHALTYRWVRLQRRDVGKHQSLAAMYVYIYTNMYIHPFTHRWVRLQRRDVCKHQRLAVRAKRRWEHVGELRVSEIRIHVYVCKYACTFMWVSMHVHVCTRVHTSMMRACGWASSSWD
jgi:hypothetical protein